MRKSGFWALYGTQFLGAFNDNLFKNALVILVTFKGVTVLGLPAAAFGAVAGGLFILPFFLFSPVAGLLSDRLPKDRLFRATKLAEVIIMVVAALGFALGAYGLLLLTLFLMGAQSAFFGPAKYSALPQLVDEEDLTRANAHVELGTFLAILIGTLLGGWMVAHPDRAAWVGPALISIAFAGYLTSRRIPLLLSSPNSVPLKLNPLPQVQEMWRLLKSRPALLNSALGASWFWFVGAVVLSLLPAYCKDVLGADETVVTAFLAAFTIGVGVGSILCEKLSFQRVEIGLVPFGSLGLTLFLLRLVVAPIETLPDREGGIGLSELVASPVGIRLLIEFALLAVSAGVFIVPLNTLLQERSQPTERSQVIAGANMMSALFMVVSSLALVALQSFGLSIPKILLIIAILNILVAIHIYRLVPEFTLRFLAWILTHLIYRVRVIGLDNIPREGPCVLAGNHVSFIDWLIIFGACKRPARFVMYYRFFEIPILRALFRQARVIPIAGAKENEKVLSIAFDRISSELSEGEIVCLFPEGQLTPDGSLQPLRPGLLRALERNPVPVVPFALSGLWPSIFSRNPGVRWWTRLNRPKLELRFGEMTAAHLVEMSRLATQIKSLQVEP